MTKTLLSLAAAALLAAGATATFQAAQRCDASAQAATTLRQADRPASACAASDCSTSICCAI